MAVNSPWKQKATNGGGEFDVPDAGSHPAVLVALIDLGTHQDEYQGQARTIRKVFLAWELVNEPKPGGGGNFVVGRDYNLSFGQKAKLRETVEKWRGKAFSEGDDFDLSALLGKPCLITLVHKTSQNSGKTYAKIDGVTALPKGMAAGKATVGPVQWAVDSGDQIPDEPWLPFVYGEPLRQVIERSAEFKAGGGAGRGDADESPF